MRLKNHPEATVEVYVDGRVKLHTAPRRSILDAFKIGLITVAVKNSEKSIGEKMSPGRYRLTVTNFSWFKQATDYNLHRI